MRRRVIASIYLRSPAGLRDVALPFVHDWALPIWHIFPIRHPNRNGLKVYLKSKEVDTLIHYPVPPHLSAAYADLGVPKGAFPIAEALAATELSLPIGPHLSLDDVDYIVNVIREYILISRASY